MQTRPIQLTDVIYNAASQCFEALVTVHDGDTSRKYPCAINAPIDMSFDEAARGLATKALRQHEAEASTFSQVVTHVPAQRAGRPKADPMRLLESLVHLTGRRAA